MRPAATVSSLGLPRARRPPRPRPRNRRMALVSSEKSAPLDSPPRSTDTFEVVETDGFRASNRLGKQGEFGVSIAFGAGSGWRFRGRSISPEWAPQHPARFHSPRPRRRNAVRRRACFPRVPPEPSLDFGSFDPFPARKPWLLRPVRRGSAVARKPVMIGVARATRKKRSGLVLVRDVVLRNGFSPGGCADPCRNAGDRGAGRAGMAGRTADTHKGPREGRAAVTRAAVTGGAGADIVAAVVAVDRRRPVPVPWGWTARACGPLNSSPR